MSNIEKFEDLIAWQKARILTRRIYQATRIEPFNRDFGLSHQIQRASVSIMSNIAEGYERVSPAEFHRFLLTAKGSCAEVRCQLYIARDNDYMDEKTFNELLNLCQEIGRIIGGLRLSVQKRKLSI